MTAEDLLARLRERGVVVRLDGGSEQLWARPAGAVPRMLALVAAHVSGLPGGRSFAVQVLRAAG